MEGVRISFRRLVSFYDTEVLHSHGDHVPSLVRHCSTLLFWLPRFLKEPRLSPGDEIWSGAQGYIDIVLKYVSDQNAGFNWPTTSDAVFQYKTLMMTWWRLAQVPDINREVWPRCTSSHGAEERQDFCWLTWWRLSHMDPRFCPAGSEGAFSLYHFTGMFGISEARAESICSSLQRYAPKEASQLSLDRIIEKTVLASGHVEGNGGDDIFILRCWAEYFGGASPSRFSFDYKHKRARARKYSLGGGAAAVHSHVHERNAQARTAFRAADLKSVPRVSDVRQTWSVKKWHRFLKRDASHDAARPKNPKARERRLCVGRDVRTSSMASARRGASHNAARR